MNLTKTAKEALVRVHTRGPLAWCEGGRAGGATARMFDRLQRAGYVTEPPYELTWMGREAIAKESPR